MWHYLLITVSPNLQKKNYCCKGHTMLYCTNTACFGFFFPFFSHVLLLLIQNECIGWDIFCRSAYLCTLNTVYFTIPLGHTEMQAKEKTIKTIKKCKISLNISSSPPSSSYYLFFFFFFNTKILLAPCGKLLETSPKQRINKDNKGLNF